MVSIHAGQKFKERASSAILVVLGYGDKGFVALCYQEDVTDKTFFRSEEWLAEHCDKVR